MSDEEEAADEELKYAAAMQAGELYVQIEGESSDEAERRVKALWRRAIEDVDDLSRVERKKIGLL